MKQSCLAKSLSIAISNRGLKAIQYPKYLQHIKKTIVIKFKNSNNGKIIYIDDLGDVMLEYPKTFNCDVFNPPTLGIIEEYEIPVENFSKWAADVLYNPKSEYQPPLL